MLSGKIVAMKGVGELRATKRNLPYLFSLESVIICDNTAAKVSLSERGKDLKGPKKGQ